MPTEPQLEAYLSALDRALTQIPVSDRADIITEIRSHVLEAQQKDPTVKLNSILASLGEPETVANRFLLERGLKTGKPPKSPMVKWLTIGFLGTMGMLFLALFLLIWKFTPLIQVNDKNEQVRILGGLISVDGKEGLVRIGSTNLRSQIEGRTFEGSKAISAASTHQVRIPFTNGDIEVKTSHDNRLAWHCKIFGGSDAADVKEIKSTTTLDFSGSSAVRCSIQIPKNMKTSIEGNNGKLTLARPEFDLSVKLDNGKINIQPSENHKYRYEMNVVNGVVDRFDSSEAADALQMKVSIVNGSISRD